MSQELKYHTKHPRLSYENFVIHAYIREVLAGRKDKQISDRYCFEMEGLDAHLVEVSEMGSSNEILTGVNNDHLNFIAEHLVRKGVCNAVYDSDGREVASISIRGK